MVHTQDTICHLPVATQSVKDSVFTEQELQKIQNELRKRYARSEIEGTRLDGNISGSGIKGNHLVVNLCFEGPIEPTPNNQRYTSDTLGIHLYPEFSAYPYTAHTATFVLFNQSDHEIGCGDPYRITYENQHGVWRTLPINTNFHCVGYIIKPGKQFLFKAHLNPNVLPNRPGRYRFFYEVELTDKKQKIMLMTEFRLADIKEAVRDSSDVISVNM